MSFSLRALLLFSLAAIKVSGQDSSPTGPTNPGIAPNCNAFHTVVDGDSCFLLESTYGITHEQFIEWNPDVSDDCLTNFWLGSSYCVGVGDAVSTTTEVSSTTTTMISSSTAVNTTYSIRVPITSRNLTTSTIGTEWPPTKTQAGQPNYCNRWHMVGSDDTCQSLVNIYGTWMSADDLLAWNPELGSDCSGLYYGWWVCVGIQPQSSMTLTYTTTFANVTIPPYDPFTPTTLPSINSSFTAAPTQPGLASGCQAFYQAEADETCRQVLEKYNYIDQQQFFDWNPALEENCDGLWSGYWYCVASFASTDLPMPPTVTASPSPVQTGIAGNCVAWYITTVSDTCDAIVSIFGSFSKDDFIKWNPGVWSDCSNIHEGYYYCVAVPGTPTTRTAPVPTTTFPTDTPTQTGIAADCSNFWLVSSTDTCDGIARLNGITLANFLSWNPAVGTTSCDNLSPDYYVCVGVSGGTSQPGPTTGITTPPITSPPSSSTTGAPPSSSTTEGGAVTTPVPIQDGMVAGCRRFYFVQSGDGCWAIADAAGIDINDFYKWNPAIGTDCLNLWLDTYVCIGIGGPVTTITSGPPVPT